MGQKSRYVAREGQLGRREIEMRLFWAMVKKAEMTEEDKEEYISIMTMGRTSHISECTDEERSLIVDNLLELVNDIISKDDDMDRKRKGLLAAIFGWLKCQGKSGNMEYVKGIACQAAKVEDFNKINKRDLVRLYNHFTNEQANIMLQKYKNR